MKAKTLNILLLGPTQSGKSALVDTIAGIKRVSEPTIEDSISTYHSQTQSILNLIEIGGDHISLLKSAVDISDGFILLHKFDDLSSFENLVKIYRQLKKIRRIEPFESLILANTFDKAYTRILEKKFELSDIYVVDVTKRSHVEKLIRNLVTGIKNNQKLSASSADSEQKRRDSFEKRGFSFRLSADRLKDLIRHQHPKEENKLTKLEIMRNQILHLGVDFGSSFISDIIINRGSDTNESILAKEIEKYYDEQTYNAINNNCFNERKTFKEAENHQTSEAVDSKISSIGSVLGNLLEDSEYSCLPR